MLVYAVSHHVCTLFCCALCVLIITLRPGQNGRLFADDTFKRIFLNENIKISIKISLKLVPNGLINNIPALGLIMAWRRPGDKPLLEPMMVRSLTHICVIRPQWVILCVPSGFIYISTHILQVVSVVYWHANRIITALVPVSDRERLKWN